MTVEGLGTVVFCHGSPRSDIELITPRTPETRVGEAIGQVTCDVLATGHTHLQFDRKIDSCGALDLEASECRITMVRPAPAGAVLGPGVDLRITPYDLRPPRMRQLIRGSDRWIQTLLDPPTAEDVIIDAELREFSD